MLQNMYTFDIISSQYLYTMEFLPHNFFCGGRGAVHFYESLHSHRNFLQSLIAESERLWMPLNCIQFITDAANEHDSEFRYRKWNWQIVIASYSNWINKHCSFKASFKVLTSKRLNIIKLKLTYYKRQYPHYSRNSK